MSDLQRPVYSVEGVQTEATQNLSAAVFDVKPNDHAIYQAVVASQTRSRQGTRSTKTRAEVSGSKRKMYRQKGTGNARAGSIRSGVRVGGGRIFGPRAHPHAYLLPKKVKALARRSALSYRAQEDAVLVVEDFTLDEPKTGRMAALFQALGVSGQRVLFVTAAPSPVLLKSCRNLKNVVIRHGNAFSTLDIVGCQRMVIQQGALAEIAAAEAS